MRNNQIKKTKTEGEKDEQKKKERCQLQEGEPKFSERLLLFRKHVIRTAETIFKYRQGRKCPAYCNKKQSEWPYNDI